MRRCRNDRRSLTLRRRAAMRAVEQAKKQAAELAAMRASGPTGAVASSTTTAPTPPTPIEANVEGLTPDQLVRIECPLDDVDSSSHVVVVCRPRVPPPPVGRGVFVAALSI